MDELIQTLEKERKRALLPFWVFLALVALTLPLFVYVFPVWIIVTATLFTLYAVINGRFTKRLLCAPALKKRMRIFNTSQSAGLTKNI